jgi:hypothetical protein
MEAFMIMSVEKELLHDVKFEEILILLILKIVHRYSLMDKMLT